MSEYTNLPGVNIDVKDGQLLLSQDTTSNSVLIVAEAKAATGIIVPEEPTLIRTERELRDNFGSFLRQGELNPIAAEWLSARRSGFRNIYLLAIEGMDMKSKFAFLQDMLFNIVTDMGIGSIVISGLYADDEVEGLKASDFEETNLSAVEGVDTVHLRKATVAAKANQLGLESAPVSFVVKQGEMEVAVTVVEELAPEALLSFLNRQLAVGISENGMDLDVFLKLDAENKVIMETSSPVTIEGEEIITALGLTSATEVMEGKGSFATLLGHFCERQSTQSNSLIGYISVKPSLSTGLREIRSHQEALVKRRNDVSRYVQVIAGPPVGITVPGSLRTQWVSGATQYAGLVNSLEPQIATTNQILPAVNTLRYNLSVRQLEQLVGNKYVTFKVKNNQIIVVDGVTTAPDLYAGQELVKSDFTRLSTLRTTNHIVTVLREALDAFIGQPNEFPLYNAMNTAIKAVIRDAISDAVIQDAKYTIRMGDTLDSSIVDLTILPQFELRTIDVSIGLSTPDNFN